MKRHVFTAVFLLTLGGLYAQIPSELELIQTGFNMEKKLLTAEIMELSPEEGELFWPIYREYEAERSGTAKRRIRLLYDYVNSYQRLSNDQAKTWAKEVFKLWKSELRIKRKYYKRVSKKLSPLLAVRFFQMEELINVEVKGLILENMPIMTR